MFAHVNKLFSIHTSANVHPTVVSPRRLRQLNSKSSLTCLPATSAVNTIKIVADI
jgi:hypothetical protein